MVWRRKTYRIWSDEIAYMYFTQYDLGNWTSIFTTIILPQSEIIIHEFSKPQKIMKTSHIAQPRDIDPSSPHIAQLDPNLSAPHITLLDHYVSASHIAQWFAICQRPILYYTTKSQSVKGL